MARGRERKRKGAARSRPRRTRGGGGARLAPADVVLAFRSGPVAAAVVAGGRIALANEAFARAVGADAAALVGKSLREVLPPDGGGDPVASEARSYRTSLGGIPARVDIAACPGQRKDASPLASVVLSAWLADLDEAADRALLALSRELAEARAEEQLTAALARAVDVLFPGRSFAIRLVDPKTLALRTLYARGHLRASAKARFALRRAAVERTGLSRAALEDAGVLVTEADEPLFEGSEACITVPLAVAGELFGAVNLEYPRGSPGEREQDAPLLFRVANHAALGVRNLRSIEELTTLKTYLEGLLEHANALVVVVNRCREVIVWNAALVTLTGFDKDGVLGDDLFAFVPPDDRAALEEVLLRGFQGEPLAGHETRLLRKDGGEVRIAVNTAPILDASGDVEGVIAIGQDLTLVRSLQAAAEHAERLAGIGRLVAGVVHELNNPLTAVNMYSDVLVEKLEKSGHDPADVEKLKAIKESGLRIQRLARDLVAYAKPTGARVEPVELSAVVEEAERLAKPLFEDSSAVLEKRLDDVPAIEGNRASLVQVVLNLVRNAAQAAERGSIRVGLERAGESVRVLVEDDGPGMAPDVAARAFEPFFTTRPGTGIGLGLPIVQEIVQRHGGSISLDTAPGKGTRVSVLLPVRRARAAGYGESERTA